MSYASPITSGPIALDHSTESKVYGLFALAMALTLAGVWVGIQYAAVLLTTGLSIVFVIAELGIILTSRLWMRVSPWNLILFAAFPLLSGITITPYLLSVLTGYANGGSILVNALLATVCMTLAIAVFARSTSINLSVFSRGVFMGLIGLLVLSVLQIFVPAFRTTGFELMLSGGGVVIFAIFTAIDLQRVAEQSRSGANPFLMALSLYLDIFNLFLFILRFMLVIAGDRR